MDLDLGELPQETAKAGRSQALPGRTKTNNPNANCGGDTVPHESARDGEENRNRTEQRNKALHVKSDTVNQAQMFVPHKEGRKKILDIEARNKAIHLTWLKAGHLDIFRGHDHRNGHTTVPESG